MTSFMKVFSLGGAFLYCATASAAVTNQPLQGSVPPQPMESSPSVVPHAPAKKTSAPAGVRVTLSSVEFSGNTLFDSATLRHALGSIAGRQFDMAGLNNLANTIVGYYRSQGYPFVQTIIPPQNLKGGVLHLRVLEGRYGAIQADGSASLKKGAQPFLDHYLSRGNPIKNSSLERALLILNDQPGTKIHPTIRPGSGQGEGDLTVDVVRTSRITGEIGADNTGNQNTGEYRLPLTVNINSPFRFGDKLTLNGLYTDRNMWLGAFGYETPLGPSGLRGYVGYAHTSYILAGQFSALNDTGYANITTLRLSYPLLRSQASNVLLMVSYLTKALSDQYATLGITSSKHSKVIPLEMQFDHRDTWFGGGVTYGVVSASTGQLSLDSGLLATDASTAGTQGSFNKANLDVARIQKITESVSLYGRYSGQWAGKNLDPSEKFDLGGFYGVRAYPMGEGMGDTGWLTQIELRYTQGELTPFLLYDAASSDLNASPWNAGSVVRRKLAGAGMGVRMHHNNWSLESTLAWRTQGGLPTADNTNRNPRLFLVGSYRF